MAELAFFYLDTDVVSRLADGLLPNLVTVLSSKKIVPVYSSVLLSESFGKPKFDKKVNFLDNIEAHRIEVDDHECSDAKVYDERASEVRNRTSNDGIANGIERVLDRFSLFAHGSKSGPSMDQVSREFEGEIRGILEYLFSLSEELPAESKMALKKLTQSVVRGENSYGKATSESNRRELEKYISNYASVSSIKPPNVIQKISQRVPADQRKEFLKLFGITPPSFSTLIEAAAVLGVMGFNRDKDIGKEANAKSMRAACSDRHDVQHIAHGLICHAFVTGDRRSARKAFALVEFFGLGCVVAFVEPCGQIYCVSEKYWP
jgi:hypothetical protein